MNLRGILVFVTLFAVPILCGAPTDVLNSQDSARFKTLLTNAQNKNHLWGDWLKTHGAVSALRRLGAQPAEKQSICSDATKALAKSDNLQDILHITSVLRNADCPTAPFSSAQKTQLQAALKSDDLNSIHAAVTSVFNLAASKKSIVDDFEFKDVIDTVVSLMEVDGTFKSSGRSETSSAVNAGLALYVVGTIFKNVNHLEETSRDNIRAVTENIQTLLDASAVGDSFDFSRGSSFSGVASAYFVLRGLNALASAVQERIDVTDAHINKLGSLFVSNKHVSTVEEIFFVLEGLSLVAENPIHIPLVLRVTRADPLTVRVTNVLDQFAAAVNVKLNQAVDSSDASNVVAKDQKLSAASGDKAVEYSLQKKLAGEPGFYALTFSYEPASGSDERFKAATRVERSVKIFAGADLLKSFEIAASDSPKGTDIRESDQQKASYPNALKKTITPENAKYIHAKIGIETSSKFIPAQVFLQLTHVAKNSDAYFVAKLAPDQETQTKKTFLVKLNLDSSEFIDSVYGAGEYTINVIVGDALLPHGSTWAVGKLTLTVASSAGAASTADPFASRPDIAHAFRPEERRTNGFIAFIFTVLCGLPFALLIFTLMGFGLKYSFPGGATDFMYTAIFQGSIAAILFLYFLYWVSLNIFQALALVSIVAVVAVLSGNRALKALNRASQKQHKE